MQFGRMNLHEGISSRHHLKFVRLQPRMKRWELDLKRKGLPSIFHPQKHFSNPEEKIQCMTPSRQNSQAPKEGFRAQRRRIRTHQTKRNHHYKWQDEEQSLHDLCGQKGMQNDGQETKVGPQKVEKGQSDAIRNKFHQFFIHKPNNPSLKHNKILPRIRNFRTKENVQDLKEIGKNVLIDDMGFVTFSLCHK